MLWYYITYMVHLLGSKWLCSDEEQGFNRQWLVLHSSNSNGTLRHRVVRIYPSFKSQLFMFVVGYYDL